MGLAFSKVRRSSSTGGHSLEGFRHIKEPEVNLDQSAKGV